MNERGPAQSKLEQAPLVTKAPCFTEQLLALRHGESDIPYELRTDRAFLEQVQDRKKCIETYTLYRRNPKNRDILPKLYDELSKSLDDDKQFARALLYLPFNLVPDITTDRSPEALMFVSSYKRAFDTLLSQTDFRADFMDGDILEPELRKGELPEQVVKAPHLLPWLMRKGIFSQDEVISLVEKVDTPLLAKAYAEVVSTLYHEELLDDSIIDTLLASPHQALNRLHLQIKKDTPTKYQPLDPEQSPKEILKDYASSYNLMQQKISLDNTSLARKQWQTEARGEYLQNEFAHKLAPHVETDLDTGTLDILIAQNNAPRISLIITTLRIRAGTEFETDGAVHEHTEKLIKRLLSKISNSKNSTVVTQAKDKLLAYAHQYGVSVVSPENPQFMQEEETGRTKRYLESLSFCAHFIEKDPLLSQTLYPVTLSLGSHAKGYAKEESDVDLGVFVKPETQEGEREMIQERLKEMFSQQAIFGSCIEFWIQRNEDGLSINNYENPDQKRGDGTLTHPLTGEWIGNIEATKSLRQDLMRMYLMNKNKTIANSDARSVWLRDIEHNMLQYRLMHKGYASHLPPATIKQNSHHFSIDGESMFYDEGYRTIAFDLYLKKVFLPVVLANP